MSKVLTIESENNKYKVIIPTYGELESFVETLDIENIEDAYYQWLSTITMTPSSMMVALSDLGIDYETMRDYDLFCLMYNNRTPYIDDFLNYSIKVNGIGFSDYTLCQDKETEEIVLYNADTKSTFSRSDYGKVVNAIAEEFKIKRDNCVSANETMKKYMIELRRKRERMGKKSNYPNIIKRINKVQSNIDSIKDLPISEVFTANAAVTAFEECQKV